MHALSRLAAVCAAVSLLPSLAFADTTRVAAAPQDDFIAKIYAPSNVHDTQSDPYHYHITVNELMLLGGG
ncbi:MAG TPA: hypothetical protein VEI03_09140 [Stellaceae bacterium]|nr:hypothetical protein [Stellaceae bacterium]